MTLIKELELDILNPWRHTENEVHRSSFSKVWARPEETDRHRQTDRQTDATERITSRIFREVINVKLTCARLMPWLHVK